jgi:hypothetical protein
LFLLLRRYLDRTSDFVLRNIFISFALRKTKRGSRHSCCRISYLDQIRWSPILQPDLLNLAPAKHDPASSSTTNFRLPICESQDIIHSHQFSLNVVESFNHSILNAGREGIVGSHSHTSDTGLTPLFSYDPRRSSAADSY